MLVVLKHDAWDIAAICIMVQYTLNITSITPVFSRGVGRL